jgi:hypothetical protein
MVVDLDVVITGLPVTDLDAARDWYGACSGDQRGDRPPARREPRVGAVRRTTSEEELSNFDDLLLLRCSVAARCSAVDVGRPGSGGSDPLVEGVGVLAGDRLSYAARWTIRQ